MTLEQYWNALVKRWMLIVICIVVVGLGAYIGSRLMTRVYQAKTLVLVTIRLNNNPADITSLQASDQLVQTESQLAISDPVLLEVASHYAGLSADQIASNASTTVRVNTQLFEIDVLDASPTRAAALANDIAATLIKQQLQQTQQDNAQSQQQIQQDLTQTQQQIGALNSQITALQAKPGNEAQISNLKAQLAGLQQHYSQWQLLLSQIESAEAQSGSYLRIAQSAQPPSQPTRPDVRLNTAIGLLVGLINGLSLALLLEQLDTRIRSEEALARLVDWPVLAAIWRSDSPKKDEELVNPPPHDANVEAYRILRTNLGLVVIDKPLRTIMVTSAAPQEGKSTIAANLAIFMARAGKKTLLIDADLRRPTVGKKLGLPPNSMGLSNAIVAFAQLQTAASGSLLQSSTPFPTYGFSLNQYMHSVGLPNLQVMPAGPPPPNPPELLDSKAMGSLLAALLSSGAEVIIFDAPPLLGLSDASILATKVDGIVAVVDIERANKKSVKRMQSLLSQSGSRVLGCVVNKQRRRRKDAAYSYYYYYQAEDVSQSKQNGHFPTVPATPVLPRSPGQQ